jgi:lipopolysaccharide transport system ATP-binding protein
MADIAIRACGLSKRYRLGAPKARYRTLRDSLAGALAAPFRRGSTDARASRDLWALQDVSFEIRQGDVVGIIGCNGAGKSTLLKILSRITRPTHGHAVTYGRVGCLLEVGTGFHNELTGRENIYLNGAIMGMRRAEICRKFDEIVAFAEVERFIDTAVKHYSSGMYLRLAFAVAAHLEPEILLVDEVLAVGDAAFQQKCLGKMGEVAREGRTVLFVSHNMGAIRSLCRTGLVLDRGAVVESGPVARILQVYYARLGALQQAAERQEPTHAEGGSVFGPLLINGRRGTTILQSEPFTVSTTLRIDQPINGFSLFWIVEDMQGRSIIHLREESTALLEHVDGGPYKIQVCCPALWLSAGVYSAYFKVQLWGGYGTSRFLSDKFPLDVEGSHNSADALLQPDASWLVEKRHADALVASAAIDAAAR